MKTTRPEYEGLTPIAFLGHDNFFGLTRFRWFSLLNARNAIRATEQGTSATSLAVATGLKTFATQAEKDFAPGHFIYAYSAANPARYMAGQSTAYDGSSVTINVTNIGIAGTAADWVLLLSAAPSTTPGPSGVSGASRAISARVAAVANVAIASGLENGDTVNGVALATNDVVLLTEQTNAAENGIYVVPAAGAASRHADFASYDAHAGALVAVSEGDDGRGVWRSLSVKGGVLGTTAIMFDRMERIDPALVLASTPIKVNAIATGAVAQNTLDPAHFTNAAGSVISNTYWTPVATKYLTASVSGTFILRSLLATRDQEVDTWSNSGIVYLRLDASGKAIYFRHNGDSANGLLEIGIVTGLTEASYDGGTKYRIYRNDNLVGTFAGYNKVDTTGAHFTFGVAGYDIYVKFNGAEFVRFQMGPWAHMEAGNVALTSMPSPVGFRNITVTHLPPAPLYSNFGAGVIDMRDLGMRPIATTGSITGGSNVLTLAAKKDFRVGDWILVEIGAEAGAGLRGTVGVGGTWPSLSYADEATLQADATKPANTYAWAQSTGNVWRYVTGTWSQNPADEYYIAKAIPLGLQARITAISADGLTLTLDTPAVAAATAANVYLDNGPILNYVVARHWSTPGIIDDLRPLVRAGLTISLPPGRHAIGGQIYLIEKNGWTLDGNRACELFSPKGFSSAMVNVQSSPDTETRHFTLTGNVGDNGFGLDFPFGIEWGGFAANGLMNPFRLGIVTQTSIPQGFGYPLGVYFKESHRGLMYELIINNVWQDACGAEGSDYTWAIRCINNQVSMRRYIQWQFQWSRCKGGGTVDCEVVADQVIAGFEMFLCQHVAFVRPKAINGSMSLNVCGGCVIEDPRIFITSAVSDSFSVFNPLINVNANIGSAAYQAYGNVIRNPLMVQDGYVSPDNDVLLGIAINAGCENIKIAGGYYQAPDYAAPAVTGGPIALRSDGPATLIDGMTSVGTPKPGRYSYEITAGGKVVNCVGTRSVAGGDGGYA